MVRLCRWHIVATARANAKLAPSPRHDVHTHLPVVFFVAGIRWNVADRILLSKIASEFLKDGCYAGQRIGEVGLTSCLLGDLLEHARILVHFILDAYTPSLSQTSQSRRRDFFSSERPRNSSLTSGPVFGGQHRYTTPGFYVLVLLDAYSRSQGLPC